LENSPNQADRFVTNIALSLVDRPENVQVRTISSNQTMVLELRVAKEDVGKIIGRQGRTIRAIRTLLGAVSAKSNQRTVLDVIE
jgi:predicted RNA-binding protein YlqC (UPF0109 family)